MSEQELQEANPPRRDLPAGEKDITEFYADHATLASERPDLLLCVEHAGKCTCDTGEKQ